VSLREDLAALPRPKQGYYRLTVTGGVTRRKFVGRRYTPEPPRAKRGRVRGFSKKSRKRFLSLVNSLDVGMLDRSVFVTLTYGADWSRDGRVWKEHLDEFLRLLQREIGKKCVVWKLEYQRRGAPHFHLVVVDALFIPHGWIADTWERVIDLPDEDRGASTHVCKVKGGRNALFYVAGYLGKQSFVPDGATNTGRVWGVRNKKQAVGPRREYRLTPELYNDFLRFARKYAELRGWKASRRRDGYKDTFIPHKVVVRWCDAVTGGRNGTGVRAAMEKLEKTAAKYRAKVYGAMVARGG